MTVEYHFWSKLYILEIQIIEDNIVSSVLLMKISCLEGNDCMNLLKWNKIEEMSTKEYCDY